MKKSMQIFRSILKLFSYMDAESKDLRKQKHHDLLYRFQGRNFNQNNYPKITIQQLKLLYQNDEVSLVN